MSKLLPRGPRKPKQARTCLAGRSKAPDCPGCDLPCTQPWAWPHRERTHVYTVLGSRKRGATHLTAAFLTGLFRGTRCCAALTSIGQWVFPSLLCPAQLLPTSCELWFKQAFKDPWSQGEALVACSAPQVQPLPLPARRPKGEVMGQQAAAPQTKVGMRF